MRLIIIGCEYTGKTTLSGEIKEWLVQTMGSCQTSFHDHFVSPFVEGSGPEIQEQIECFQAMPPSVLELYTRYVIHYHTADSFYELNDHCPIDWYYADAVYAPLYYGYGRPGDYADRRVMARYYDTKVLKHASDTVLVLVKASHETIRQRLRQNPHPHNLIKEEDVELILERFEEEYTNSLLVRKITLDTTDSTPEKALEEFVEKIEPHLTDRDRLRIVSHQALHR